MADIKKNIISSLCIAASFSTLSIYSMQLPRSQGMWDIPSLCNKAYQSLDLDNKINVNLVKNASREDIECIVAETEILGSESFEVGRMPRSQVSMDFQNLQKQLSCEEILFKAVEVGRCRLVAKVLNKEPDLQHKKVLNKKPDLQHKNDSEDTCLHIAIRYQRFFIVQQLLDSGARWDSLNGLKLSPLMIAISKGDQNLVHTFLESREAKGNINHQGLKGWTPLHMAVIEQNEELVSMVLKKQPDHMIKDVTQRTALDYAKKRENKEIIALLENYKQTPDQKKSKKSEKPSSRKRKRKKRKHT